MNSDDEDAVKEEHGDELTGMYAQGCASLEDARLSEEQAQAQRAAASSQGLRVPPCAPALPAPEPERKPTPANSDDEDWSWMTEDQRRKAEIAKQMMARSTPKKSIQEPTVQEPAKGAPLEIKKATVPPQAPADQPKGAKAPPPKKGQESPETKVSTPMVTRQQAKKTSGAGGSRGVTGSGQTDTCVTKGHPPKT
jgi:hypothetical protein